jgi:hypothetical protein
MADLVKLENFFSNKLQTSILIGLSILELRHGPVTRFTGVDLPRQSSSHSLGNAGVQ